MYIKKHNMKMYISMYINVHICIINILLKKKIEFILYN